MSEWEGGDSNNYLKSKNLISVFNLWEMEELTSTKIWIHRGHTEVEVPNTSNASLASFYLLLALTVKLETHYPDATR